MTKTTIDNTTTIENDKIVSTTVTKTENPSSSTIETEVAAINHPTDNSYYKKMFL
jgi:hypothetical protein